MEEKRHFALDNLVLFFWLIGIALLYSVISTWTPADELGGLIGMLALSALFLVAPAVLMPCGYVFDREGVTITYLFLPNERYLWKNIYAIRVDYDSSGSTKLPFFSTVFHISGRSEGKQRFYMSGHIRKSRRTRRLIEAYWDGKVTGYFFEGFKARLEARKNQKSVPQKLAAEEVAALEREARAKVRTLLSPYQSAAEKNALLFTAQYRYITDEGDESNTRPQKAYTYTLILQIKREGEKNEDYMLYTEHTLVHVRCGKKAFRGVENETVYDEILTELQESFDAIAQNGFEAYCNEINGNA